MKKIRIFLLLLTLVIVAFYSFQDPSNWPFRSSQTRKIGTSFSRSIRVADIIAFVSVATAGVTSVIYTNPAGRVATNFFADAKIERVLKGKPSKTIRLRGEGALPAGLVLFGDGEVGEVLKVHQPETSRFLVVVERSGDYYTAADRNGVAAVLGSVPGRGWVMWGTCGVGADEAIAIIQRELRKW